MRRTTNSADGVRIGYELVGEGAPLLLAHGSLGSSVLWRTLGYVEALQAEHQLILVDARGHGDSDKPTTMDAYEIDRSVGDVIAVLDDCGVHETHTWAIRWAVASDSDSRSARLSACMP